MKNKVIIIGGGAAGLMAAITAARKGQSVILLEHKDRAGRKLLATGNGRCNFTNLNQQPEYYHCGVPAFPLKALEAFPVSATLEFFAGLGIPGKDRDGYVYPASGQAASVLEGLLLECQHLQVQFHYNVEVQSIKKEKGHFLVSGTAAGKKQSYQGKWVIIAAGSQASPVTGSDGSGYQLARALGHSLIQPVPALVQLRAKESFFKQIAGVRITGQIDLYVDGHLAASDTGEIQMTDYGISGIPVFQVSRFAAQAIARKQSVSASIDFMPEQSRPDLKKYLCRRQEQLAYRSCEDFLTGLFPKKINILLLKLANIPAGRSVKELILPDLERLIKNIKAFQVEIIKTNPFENAQVCAGGVDTHEINPETMESRLVPGLFFAGEIIDVDGICGGYNLQWAWSSGYTAGSQAGKV